MHRRPTLQYELREEQSFSQCVESLGGYARVDNAITGLIEALRIDPQDDPVVEGMKDVRLCMTGQLGDCPAMRWWYRIDHDAEAIDLLYAEAIGDSDAEG